MRILGLLFSMLWPVFSFAGGAVGNGGDSVYCESSPTNAFRGYYNLDYIINKINGMEFSGDFEKVVGPKDPPDMNFLRLIEATKEYPVLVQELKEFREQIYSNKYNARYVWKKAPFGVVEIADEQLRLQIPPNCLSQKNNVIQTIFRVQKPWIMVWKAPGAKYETHTWGADFTYSNEIMAQMSSLQLSFLYFHEWLWNLTEDPEMIRDLNAIFHSTGWENGGADAKIELLKKFRWTTHVPMRLFSKGGA